MVCDGVRTARATRIFFVAAGLFTWIACLAWWAQAGNAALPAPPTTPGGDPFAFDPELFQTKRPPGSGDWMASQKEVPQSFDAYVGGKPVRVSDGRRVIVIQPLGPFSAGDAAVLESLREYTSVFFQLPVRLAPARQLPMHGFRVRPDIAPRHVQFLTGVLLSELAAHLPDDAVCVLGVTMMDLYPQASWNFVFGQASISHRVGIYSLWRYGETEDRGQRRTFLTRALKVLAHEAGHMFSILHCQANECLMNGSMSLGEMDRAPLHLCPICLHKLQWNLGFDVARREAHLLQFYQRHGLADEASWTTKRLRRLAR